jgi:SpoVK/Ycf46/Vps4 family AAA+-type ATPase
LTNTYISQAHCGTSLITTNLVFISKIIIQDTKVNLPTAGDGVQKKTLTGEEELDQLIGLDSIKRMVKKIKAYAKRNKGEADFNLHMCFYGNPGTGKTEVARIISRILYDAGVLEEAKLIETDAHGLLGRYVGETGPKTEAKINDAMGGVLFIDEAYGLLGTNSIGGGVTNYGEEAISVLLKEMEDRRGQFCVILAGYKDEMRNLLNANPGFASRIQFTLDFPNYTREELGKIARVFLEKKKYSIEADAMERLLDAVEHFRNQDNFANARTTRNILDQVLMNQNLRTEDVDFDNTVVLSDVEDYLLDEGINLNSAPKKKGTIGFL